MQPRMLGAALLLLTALAPGPDWTKDFVDPTDHRSPNGAYVLRVDPSERSGAGPAHYRLRHLGAEVWAAELPYTLRELALTDTGACIGYGATNGAGFGGEFVVAILDSAGAVRFEERTERRSIPVACNPPTIPDAVGLMLDPSQTRCTIRISEQHVQYGAECWWRYDLLRARRLADLKPSDAMDRRRGVRLRLHDARPLPGTDLHLLHWSWWEYTDRKRDGAVFTLMCPEGRMVWQHELQLECTSIESQEAQDALAKRLREPGLIRSVGPDRRFSLWFLDSSCEVTLEALPWHAKRRWEVVEIGRVPHAAPVEAPRGLRLPDIALTALDVVPLQRRARGRSGTAREVLHELGTCSVIDGRIWIQDRRSGSVFAWDESGRLELFARAERADARRVDPYGRSALAPDGSLWVQAERDEYLGWSAKGERLGYRKFERHPTFARDGRGVWSRGGRELGFVLSDFAGRRLSSFQRQPDERWLRYYTDAMCLEDGTLAVLSSSGVLLYEADGQPLRMHALEGRRIPDRIDAHGDWLLTSESSGKVQLLQRSSGAAFALRSSVAEGKSAWVHGFSADGRRLLSVERNRHRWKLHRHALP